MARCARMPILAILVLLRYNEREVLATIAEADKKGERF